MTTTDLLKDLSNITNKDNPDKIRKLILSTRAKIIIPKLVLGKGCYIYRATPITNISDINDSKRLSYKPASLNKTYQRASTPFNTMFYGIVCNTNKNAVVGCLGETCDCLRNIDSPNKHYKVVVSEWILKKDVALVQMISVKGDNKSEVFNNQKEIIKLIRENNAQNEQENIEFLEFMSNEFKKKCQQESDYWISAIYTEFLTQLMGYDGIVYESVQAIDPALSEVKCVALTPNFTDNNLSFKQGIVYEFDFNGINEAIVPQETGRINF